MKSKLNLITGGAGFMVLGYAPRVSFHHGLMDLAEWLRGQVATDRVAEAKAEPEARGLTV